MIDRWAVALGERRQAAHLSKHSISSYRCWVCETLTIRERVLRRNDECNREDNDKLVRAPRVKEKP